MLGGTCALLLFLFAADAPKNADRGKRLFDSQCALCHGIGGTGGRGPGLARAKLKHARDDAGLRKVITEGVNGTEMPGAWQLPPKDVEDVAAYVHSLMTVEREPLPGDVTAGEQLYKANRCGSCHVVRGEGTAFGPELTEVGAKRSPAYLRDALLKPEAAFPEGFDYIEAQNVRGIRVNEDTFTVQVKDNANRFHSFRKDSVAIHRLAGQSPMPSYSALSAKQIDDVVAYLASLRGDE